MKKDTQGRAQSSAGKAKNQTQKAAGPATMRRVYVRFPESVIPMIDKAAEFRGESRTEFILDAVRAKNEAVADDMAIIERREQEAAAGTPAEAAPDVAGQRTELVTNEHEELRRACHEACDTLFMLALSLSGFLEHTPGGGDGVQSLAEYAGRRLMGCLRSAYEENLRNGGGR
jgi:uncharacterized protein (DUF1778 family)